MTDREHRVRRAIAAYESGAWGRATCDGDLAAGLCTHASLVLLEHLHRAGVEEAELWHLGMPRDDSGFAPSDEHYVVVVDDDVIDPTARQFDKDGDAITRRPLEVVAAPWHSAQEVRIGYIPPFIGRDLHEIPENWRSLADVEPPGDAIGGAYPGPWPTRGITTGYSDEPASPVLAHSDWVVVQPGSSIDVEIDLTAAPGSYLARQAMNVGGNVYENIVTIDLGSVEHP